MLEDVWASKTISLLVEVVSSEGVTGSFFISSSIFCMTISMAVWSLDLRLACLVVGSLTKGFSRVGVGLLGFYRIHWISMWNYAINNNLLDREFLVKWWDSLRINQIIDQVHKDFPPLV